MKKEDFLVILLILAILYMLCGCHKSLYMYRCPNKSDRIHRPSDIVYQPFKNL